jgi:hypothetical protein
MAGSGVCVRGGGGLIAWLDVLHWARLIGSYTH